ncbi:hypothetical protein F5X96DRAFT_668155 [Biscogniauxia mediterranea]|nr:hypothetical protein F5X96DRAFT_668155 [Biscogniauxia mediterranea]
MPTTTTTTTAPQAGNSPSPLAALNSAHSGYDLSRDNSPPDGTVVQTGTRPLLLNIRSYDAAHAAGGTGRLEAGLFGLFPPAGGLGARGGQQQQQRGPPGGRWAGRRRHQGLVTLTLSSKGGCLGMGLRGLVVGLAAAPGRVAAAAAVVGAGVETPSASLS